MIVFFVLVARATTAASFTVADAFASTQPEALVDGSPAGLVYAAFWPDGANPADDPAAVNAWHGSAADWIDMYDPRLRTDREAAFFYAERCSQRMTDADTKTYNAENYSVVLIPYDSNLPFAVAVNYSCNVALYAPDGATALQDAISWRHNATYEIEFSLKFRYTALAGHVGSGLFAGATVLVGEKIFGAGINGTDVGPADGLAGVWMTNYANDTNNYRSLTNTSVRYYYFGSSGGPSVVGYHLGPRFMCLSPTCCEQVISKFSPINWTVGDETNFHGTFVTPNETTTAPSQFCDWRNKADGATWTDALSLPYFPEHVDPTTTAENNMYNYSSWYKVKITVFPVGYIANVNLPDRAYAFSVTGQRAGTVIPQIFAGAASNSSGLGVGLYAGSVTRICNMTIRRLFPIAEHVNGSTTSTVPTIASASTMFQATEAPLLRNKYLSSSSSSPKTAGPFFMATVVFFTLALACSACSAWRAARARQRLREQRIIMLRL